MKKVYQTLYDAKEGDCFAACVASILEDDLKEYPNFWRLGSSTVKYWDSITKWLLENRGLGLLSIQISNRFTLSFMTLVGCYAMACVPSQRHDGVFHSVVVTWIENPDESVSCKIVHDPSELNKREYEFKEISEFTFLIKS